MLKPQFDVFFDLKRCKMICSLRPTELYELHGTHWQKCLLLLLNLSNFQF